MANVPQESAMKEIPHYTARETAVFGLKHHSIRRQIPHCFDPDTTLTESVHHSVFRQDAPASCRAIALPACRRCFYDLACNGKSSDNSCKNLNNAPNAINGEEEREKERKNQRKNKEKEDEDEDEDGDEEKKKLNSESLAKNTRFSLTLSQDEKKMKSEDDMMVRMTAFYETLLPYVRIYGREMVRDFFDYWTEPTPSGTRMRFELAQYLRLPCDQLIDEQNATWIHISHRPAGNRRERLWQ
jgi:hypothetical protein